jgi:hypothetical protein
LNNYVDYSNAVTTFYYNREGADQSLPLTLLDFTLIFKEVYREVNMTVEDIIVDLSQVSTIYYDFKVWFGYFFGPKGVITLNETVIVVEEELTLSGSNPNIPVGMEMIVEWISMQVKMEIHRLCPSCNMTGPLIPSGNGTNETDTLPEKLDLSNYTFSAENYQLPEICNFTADNSSVCCSLDMKRSCYNFSDLNSWVQNDVSRTVNDI